MKHFGLGLLAFLSLHAGAFPSQGGFLQDIHAEERFQVALQDPLSIATDEIQGLEISLYRMEAYATQFQQALKEMNGQRARDSRYTTHPLEAESYQQLMEMKQVSDNLEAEVEGLVSRLRKTAVDIHATQEERDRASRAIEQITAYLENLPAVDRIQMVNLVEAVEGKAAVTPVEFPLEVMAQFDNRVRQSTQQTTPALERQMPPPSSGGGQTPKGRSWSWEYRPDIGEHGNVSGDHFPRGVWALTFDDGPDPANFGQLEELLLKYRDTLNPTGIKASFFWVGQRVQEYPQEVQRAIQDGFSVNCHSWSHELLTHASDEDRIREVNYAANFERKAFHQTFHFYRCPWGACFGPAIPEVREMIRDLGLVHAFWSVDSMDWFYDAKIHANPALKNFYAAASFEHIKSQMNVQPGGVILMHETHQYSVDTARQLLTWIKDENDSGINKRRFYTLDQATRLDGKPGI